MGRRSVVAAVASIATITAPIPAPAIDNDVPSTTLRPSRMVEIETVQAPTGLVAVEGRIALIDESDTGARLVGIDGETIETSAPIGSDLIGILPDGESSWTLDEHGRMSLTDGGSTPVLVTGAGPAAVDPTTGNVIYFDSSTGWVMTADVEAGRLRERRLTDARRHSDVPVTALAVEAVTGDVFLLLGTELIETNSDGRLIGRYTVDADIGAAEGAVVTATLDPTDDPANLSFFALTAQGSLIEMPLTTAVALAAPTVSATLVKVTDTSLYSPPSPDPSGIGYSTGSGTLSISDGEVNEIPNLFTGDNVFTTDLAGNLINTSSTMAFSNEPTGIAFNPANGNIYISDDTGTRAVYQVELGPDSMLGTGDDIVWTHDAGAYGSDDPEGVAFDSARGHVIMVDGVGEEVYDIDPGPNGVLDGIAPSGDDTVTSFDVTALGITDPEGVEYNPDNQSLYILGHNDLIAETTITGEIIRYIDVASLGMVTPAGLAYAPGSLAPGERHLYLVDRGVDNNNDPDENDGRLFEISFGATSGFNMPPTVDAGPDLAIEISDAAVLDGTVSDDGLPNPPAATSATWTKVSGLGSVTFTDPNAVDTTATFSAAGTYTLRLSATDGSLGAFDDVTVSVTGPGGESGFEAMVSMSTDDAEEEASGAVDLNSSDLELTFDGSNQTVGIRFGAIPIPNGATILAASIQFTVDETPSDPTALVIQGESIDSAATFTSVDFSISSRPRTSASVPWNPAPWPTTGAAGPDQQTPDLSTIVQEIVSRPGWAAGNSLAFIITGTGERVAESWDGDTSAAPKLSVLYTTTTPPTVDAGPDQTVEIGTGAVLDGTVTDDGLPDPPGAVTSTWSQTSGPGTTTFADPSAVDTTATFSATGTYVLRLTADDGESTSFDEVTITVSAGNQAPTVDAGPDQTIGVPAGSPLTADLAGTVSDDGLPNPPGAVSLTWSQVSGPGTTTFGDPSSVDTTATFSATGTYVLRLTADDGSLNAFDELAVTIGFQNAAPSVDAGTDQTILVGGVASLDGTVTDDGLPDPPGAATSTWSQTSGPGTTTFADPSSVDTTATFSAAGTYLLRLTADDGESTSFDEVTITVSAGNQAPTVDAGPDQTVDIGAGATLTGIVTDDGLPNPPAAVTVGWTKVSGPGSVTFADSTALSTTASFSVTGVYLLRLTADDGALTASDDVTISVANAPTVAEARVSAGSDDAEERSNGAVTLTSSDLELVHDRGGEQTVGMRFTGLEIPQGALITSAWVRFTTDEATSVPTDLLIQAEDVDSASSYTTAAFGISNRPRTAASVQWSPAAWNTIGQSADPQTTPDIAAVIDEVVSRPGWSTTSALSIIITGNGERVADSFEGGAANAPLIHIEYVISSQERPTVDAGPDQTVTIDDTATLDGTVTDDGLPNPPGAVTVTWSKVSGPGTVAFGNPNAVDTTATFSSPGTYTLSLSASDGQKTGSDDVEIVVTNPSGTLSFEVRVSSNSDDAEESAAGQVNINSSDLELVFDKSNQMVGIRFNGLSIPQGAAIVDAWVQFTVDETGSDPTNLIVQAEASDNAATFSNTSLGISSRTATSASASWAPPPWTTVGDAGANQRATGLAAVIQAVVSRPGWSSGNSLVLIITGTGERVAESHNGVSTAAPLLHIDYLP